MALSQWLPAADKQAGRMPASVYAQRSQALLAQLDSTSMVVLRAGDPKPRSLDTDYPYHQESNFFYLTGFEQPGAILLLHKKGFPLNGKKINAVFFKPSRESNAFTKTEKPQAERFACDTLLSMSQFDKVFAQAMTGIKTLYFSPPQPTFVNEPISSKRYFIDRDARKQLTAKYAGLQVKPVNELLSSLRQIKCSEEIQVLQKAVDITVAGLVQAFKSAEPGMYEYELQALLEYSYLRNAANGPGFPCIIGSGPNSLILHYDENSRQMQDGDVVVMDVGAEYGGYCADITRTIPINGKFTAGQRELYEVVLNTQKETLQLMKPGTPFSDVEAKAKEATARGLQKLGLIKDASEVRRFLPHGVSHNIGLDVHDVGSADTLRVNMVVTLEPGVYVPGDDPAIPEKYRNVGIRIEDDVWIVPQGHRVISAAIPKEIKDIEKMMKQKGLGNINL